MYLKKEEKMENRAFLGTLFDKYTYLYVCIVVLMQLRSLISIFLIYLCICLKEVYTNKHIHVSLSIHCFHPFFIQTKNFSPPLLPIALFYFSFFVLEWMGIF